jgi:hypothetical protein
MKKILSTLSILSVLLFFNACSEPHGTYLDLGGQDFWAFRAATNNFTANETGEVVVPIFHIGNTSTISPINVNVTFTEGEESLFTVTGTSFDSVDENNRATITISYNINDLDMGSPHTIRLSFSEQPDYPFPAGLITTTTVNITRPLDLASLTFSKLGVGEFVSDFFEEEWPQPVLLANEATVYQLPGLYEDGYNIFIVVNRRGEANITSQPAWESVHGVVEVRGTGVKEGNVITMQLNHWVPGVGQFGTFEEVLILR